MRLTGMFLIALGVILVAAAIVQVTTAFYRTAGSSMPTEAELQEIRTANLVSAWLRPLGGVAIITGIVLLWVGIVRERRRRLERSTLENRGGL